MILDQIPINGLALFVVCVCVRAVCMCVGLSKVQFLHLSLQPAAYRTRGEQHTAELFACFGVCAGVLSFLHNKAWIESP